MAELTGGGCRDHVAGPDPLPCTAPGGYRVVHRDARGEVVMVVEPYCGHHATHAADLAWNAGGRAYAEQITEQEG